MKRDEFYAINFIKGISLTIFTGAVNINIY